MNKRPTWDEYFMQIANTVKGRSTCLRRQVGCVIVKDKQILTTGYNGAPRKCKSCLDEGTCLRDTLKISSGERHELCKAVHAEQNAIAQAAYSGISTKGATIYINLQPCSLCAKMIINAGIERVVYAGNYPDSEALSVLFGAGIKIDKV